MGPGSKDLSSDSCFKRPSAGLSLRHCVMGVSHTNKATGVALLSCITLCGLLSCIVFVAFSTLVDSGGQYFIKMSALP